MLLLLNIYIYSEVITNTNDASEHTKDNLCVLYKRNENGESHSKPLFAVVAADQYFPCLPRVSTGSAIKTAFKSFIPSSNSSHNSILIIVSMLNIVSMCINLYCLYYSWSCIILIFVY